MINQIVIIACWISVIALGAILRFGPSVSISGKCWKPDVHLQWHDLASRPFHCDEATGARITAKRMESGTSQFDPTHFHGPLLSSLAIPLCRVHGESRWQDMTKGTLRLLPAITGTLLVLLPLLWRRRWGDAPMLLAAALLATSPLLVYYSRMFIHESLLGLFGILAMMALLTKPKYGIPGVFVGLMFATKESFVISIIAWMAAGGLVALGNRAWFTRASLAGAWQCYRLPVLLALLGAAATAGYYYSDGFRHPMGMVDALRTFFVYKTSDGHDKPFFYYLDFLTLPHKSGGVWWFGTPVAVMALIAYASTFHTTQEKWRNTIRFIAYAAVAHILIYSLMAYKTPWLMILPWAHVCLLAGFSMAGMTRQRPLWNTALFILAGLALVSQIRQTRHAIGRLASDERNPLAYVPTRRDVETIEPWLQQLALLAPNHSLESIAVIGSAYWPLPWYLRSFEKIGYWPTPPADLEKFQIVFAVPDAAGAVIDRLTHTHTPLPRGLRAGVPVSLFIRNDLWNAWMQADTP